MKAYPVNDRVAVIGSDHAESEVAAWWDGLAEAGRASALEDLRAMGVPELMRGDWRRVGGYVPVYAGAAEYQGLRWNHLHPFWQCCLHYYRDHS